MTDKEGCSTDTAIDITEPEKALQIPVDVVPVCYGSTNGSITLKPVGGTPPYKFSIDGGQSFQAGPVFTRGAGTYTLTAEDSKGCRNSTSAAIILRNDQPEPNFLVATRRHALDTLVI
ncbi:MAG: SprB repeat-containing protein, partial [Bacteroidota bacterium]|nr:SprB repeat-containing protein [Bacteroidota bacterium]